MPREVCKEEAHMFQRPQGFWKGDFREKEEKQSIHEKKALIECRCAAIDMPPPALVHWLSEIGFQHTLFWALSPESF